MRALTSVKEIRAQYGGALRALVGRTIHSAWVIFDEDGDDLYTSSPVVLQLEGDQQLEIWNICVTECGVTMNEVELSKPPFAWEPNHREDPRYSWLHMGHAVLARRLPSRLADIELASVDGDLCCGVVLHLAGESILLVANYSDSVLIASRLPQFLFELSSAWGEDQSTQRKPMRRT